jgi:peroxiredoxin
MNPGVVIGIEGEMWWSRETDRNEIVVVFFPQRWASVCVKVRCCCVLKRT